MASLRANVMAATCLSFAVGCHLIGGLDGYVEGSKDEDDGTGATGAGGGVGTTTSSAGGSASNGAGGAATTCNPTTCADNCAPCKVCTCQGEGAASSCIENNVGFGETCDGGYCDGGGTCAECLDNVTYSCAAPMETCDMKVCVTASCTNGLPDQGETDIDCGGPCAPCQVGEGCMGNADCNTNWCDGTLCAACNQDSNCGPGRYCDAGFCFDKKGTFGSCITGVTFHPNWCESGICCVGGCWIKCDLGCDCG